eukprot:CFRG6801T1
MSVLLGLQDEYVPAREAARLAWWENKLGGTASWLSNDHPIDQHDLHCAVCGNPLVLAVQLNAPVTTAESEQRVLYVFCCLRWACTNKPGGWYIIRGQQAQLRGSTRRTTSTIPSSTTSATAITSTSSHKTATLSKHNTSGIPSIKDAGWGVEDDWGMGDEGGWNVSEKGEHTTKELNALISKRDAQILKQPCDMPFGVPKSSTQTSTSILSTSEAKAREIDLILENEMSALSLSGDTAPTPLIENEILKSDHSKVTRFPKFSTYYVWANTEPAPAKASKHELKLIKEYENENGQGSTSCQGEEWQSEKYESVGGGPDTKTFYRFVKRLEREPRQCFRYELMGEPMNTKAKIPQPQPCEQCGAPRVFEMQILPRLITCLDVDVECDDRATDISSASRIRSAATIGNNTAKTSNNDATTPMGTGGDTMLSRGSVIDIDWATVTIYTCSKSCTKTADTNVKCFYTKEFVFVQADPDLGAIRERLRVR